MMRFLRCLAREERGDVVQWVVVTILALGFALFVMSKIADGDDKTSPANQLVNWVKNRISCVATGTPAADTGTTTCDQKK